MTLQQKEQQFNELKTTHQNVSILWAVEYS